MNNKNPTLIIPITDSTREIICSGTARLNILTAAPHNVRINIHNNSDPSCDPHTPDMR